MNQDSTENSSASKARHTPGPFYGVNDSAGNPLIRCRVGIDSHQHMAEAVQTAGRDQMVDLLNKGTHFDEMLEILRELVSYHQAGDEDLIGDVADKARAAIAKAEGKG